MQRVYTLFILAFLIQGLYAQSDKQASDQAKHLFSKLKELSQTGKFIFGQEMPTTFSHSGFKSDLDRSDCKDVVGDHPGLFGFDFHYILYKTPGEADTQKRAAAKALADGAVVSWDFHMYDNTGQSTYSARDSNRNLVRNIVNNNGSERNWYYGVLDQVIAIFKSYNYGMIYRPFHEMNGNWFWWGGQNPGDYIALFRLTVDYIRGKGVHNILYAWTPNAGDKFWDYFPGNDYVDIVGADIYEPGITSSQGSFIDLTSQLTRYADNNNKIAALTEIGTREGNSIENRPNFWTENVLNPLLGNRQANKVAYIQTWINSNWEKPYVPYAGMGGGAINDFKRFHDSPNTLFLAETAAFMKGAPLPSNPTTPPNNGGGSSGGCTDELPPGGSGFSCAQQKEWGKCSEAWMTGYCKQTCGTCGSNPPSGGGSNPNPNNGGGCNDDLPPGSGFSCAQQKEWGKCSETWMSGYCKRSCGTCNSNPPSGGGCNDNPPPGQTFSCAQQREWGKCTEGWMDGYCQVTCGKCSRAATDNNSQTYSGSSADNSTNNTLTAVVVFGGVVVVIVLVAIIFVLRSHQAKQVERP